MRFDPLKIGVASLALLGASTLLPAGAGAAAYTTGDVFIDVGGGLIREYSPTGTLVQTMNDTHPGEGDGLAFDASGDLFATAGFAANTVTEFNNTGGLVTANFGSGYTGHPESIAIDNTHGVIYIGQPDGNHQVLEFTLAGAPVASFTPTTQDRGTDWIELQSDLTTLRYTSEGNTIFTFNLGTNTQGPNFATGLPGSTAYAFRTLADGTVLVADSNEIVHLDASGHVIHTYTLAGTSLLFAINLDPNGTDFWTADYFSGHVFEINIATGTVDESWTAASGGGPFGGLAVFGELCESCGSPPPSVPEPISLALFGTGLLGIGFLRRWVS